MPFAIGFLLAFLSMAVLTYPFIKPRRQTTDPPMPEQLGDLLNSRHSLYNEIDQYDLELEIGTISEEEYEERLRNLRQQAALSLREETNSYSPSSGHIVANMEQIDRELEDRLRQVRRSWHTTDQPLPCITCGSQMSPHDEICFNCNTKPPDEFNKPAESQN